MPSPDMARSHVYPIATLGTLFFLLANSVAMAGFPGRPILLSAEGGGSGAAWVAYDNGDVLRCPAQDHECTLMAGLPAFASPVSLSAQPDQPAAWIGWSDGSLYRCRASGQCIAIETPAGDAAPPLLPRVVP